MAGVDTPRPVPIPDAMFAGRFVFDVMKYTLGKCGHPSLENIRTTIEPNDYKRPNFVKIAGISVLRLALIMRDTWRPMFISRYRSSGLVGLDVPKFLSQIVKFCIFGKGKCLQTDVETILALCNELTLFYYSKRMDYDIHNVVGSIGGCLFFLLREHQNFKETLEGLFDKFDNLKEYSKFLSNFIRRVAIPYGFRDNVSDLFYKELRQRRIDNYAIAECQKEPIKGLIEELGFLPLELYSVIAAEEAAKWPEHLKDLPGDEPESDPLVASQTSPVGSESGAVGGQMPRHRRSSRSKKTYEESRPTLPDDPPKSHASSGSGCVEKSSEGEQSTTVQSEQSQQSRTITSELGTEDEKLPQHSKSACAPTSAVTGESTSPSELPEGSESGDVDKREEEESAAVSEQSQRSTMNPSKQGTEDAKLLEQSESACVPTSAVAVESTPPLTMPADSESGAIEKKKPRRRRSSRSKTTPEKSVPDHPISKAISKSCDVEKKLFGRELTALSEPATQSQQSISNPSEKEIEDALGRMTLGASGKEEPRQVSAKSRQKEKMRKK